MAMFDQASLSATLSAAWVVLCAVAAAVLLVALCRRTGVCRLLDAGTEDIEGFYLTVLCILYAIVLAFMVFVVWSRYEVAMTTADREASCLCDVYRLGHALPEAPRHALSVTCRHYALAAVEDEWPAMAHGRQSHALDQAVDDLWAQVNQVQAQELGPEAIRDLLLDKMVELGDLRRLRLLQSRTRLPGVLWGLLLFGATLTVVFSAAFGVERLSSHATKTAVLAALIASALATANLLDQPFRGWVHVQPEAFEVCGDRFDRTDRIPVVEAAPAPHEAAPANAGH